MTNRERMDAFFAAQTPDKAPHCFWIHAPVDKRTGQIGFEEQVKFHKALGNTFIKLVDDQPPNVSTPICYPDDWKQVWDFDPSKPDFAANMDIIKRFAEWNDGKEYFCFTFFSPWGQMRRTCKDETFMLAFTKKHPPQFVDALKRMTERLKREAEVMFEAGVDFMFYACSAGEKHRMPADLFEEYVGQYDREILDFLNTKSDKNILHTCGANLRHDSYKDYKAAAYNWDTHKGNMSLKEGQAFWGKPVFGGVDNQGPVLCGTQDDCAAEAKAVMDMMGKNSFMFGAGCTIPMYTDLQNVQAMVKVVDSY